MVELESSKCCSTTGLAVWMGSLIPRGINLPYYYLGRSANYILTELTSNMATTATFLPVVAAIAVQSNFDPLLVTAAVALAAGCAFMLPVLTPNAIVFGSGYKVQMARAGFLINILGITVASLVAVFSVPYFLLCPLWP